MGVIKHIYVYHILLYIPNKYDSFHFCSSWMKISYLTLNFWTQQIYQSYSVARRVSPMGKVSVMTWGWSWWQGQLPGDLLELLISRLALSIWWMLYHNIDLGWPALWDFAAMLILTYQVQQMKLHISSSHTWALNGRDSGAWRVVSPPIHKPWMVVIVEHDELSVLPDTSLEWSW